MKVMSLPALRSADFTSWQIFLVLIPVTVWVEARAVMRPERLSQSNDQIGNRTSELPGGKAVPQPIVPPPTPLYYQKDMEYQNILGT